MNKFIGMIGKEPCNTSLENILFEISDEKLTKIVMRLINDWRFITTNIINCLNNNNAVFFERILGYARKEILRELDRQVNYHCIPEKVCNHWKCCIVTDYRNTLRLIKKVK